MTSQNDAHSHPSRVVVGMSGGVDSSVSALLLKQKGYQVIGLFMRNWEDQSDENVCSAAQEYEDVARVCEQLEIPYYSVEFIEEYWNQVFTEFVEDYRAGYTPNPDVLCNREIKFDSFFKQAMALGADYLATGHYCQIGRDRSGRATLLKGADPAKEQSYFLYTISHQVLEHVLFPIGHLKKSEVREIAAEHGLATQGKKDSTGICFIEERHFPRFLKQYIQPKEGYFKTLSGEVVGTHQGAPFYTLGQRRGLGLGGQGEPWFVVAKDTQKNIVYVERGKNHPALFADDLVATRLDWVSKEPPRFPFYCQAKARYRQPEQPCVLDKLEDGRIQVRFQKPQRALTPGQAVVFYQGDQCLGGGRIDEVGPSYAEAGENNIKTS